MRGCVRLAVAVILLGGVFALAAKTDPAHYQKKDTWQNTMLAAREALAKDDAQASKPAKISGRPADEQWTPWYHIGPFVSPNGGHAFATAYPPEKEIDLAKVYGGAKWVLHPEWTDGVVHNLQTPGESATYLYRTITVASARTIPVYCGSDDGMEFWLNGKKLISNDSPRGVTPGSDQARLQLVAGENKLLFKIYNNSGDCGFYFSTSPDPSGVARPRDQKRDDLWNLLQRDFGDAESLRQMAWERQDTIWSQDWPAGEVAVLATRYAHATRGASARRRRRLPAMPRIRPLSIPSVSSTTALELSRMPSPG